MKEGSIVMCIDVKWNYDIDMRFKVLPELYGIYTVREIFPNYEVIGGPVGIGLVEITGNYMLFELDNGDEVYVECHFRKDRFVELLPPLEEQFSFEIHESDKIKTTTYVKEKV